jgi:hypothetical protein
MFADRIDPGPPKSRAIGPVPPDLAESSYRSRARRRARYRALAVALGWRPDGRTEMTARQRRGGFGVTPGIDNEHEHENDSKIEDDEGRGRFDAPDVYPNLTYSRSVRYLSTSMAAAQPWPAAVTAWR